MITGWPSGPSTFSPVFGSTSSRSSWASAMALWNTARTAFLQENRAGPGGRPRSSRADLAKKAGVTEASLSMTEIQALPEGARIIVAWSGGNGPHEYRVHWHRGEPYAQTEEEHRQGRVDVEKWLTYYVGPRRPFTRVWALAASSPETRAGM